MAPLAFWNRRGRFRFHLRGMARSWTLHDTDALNAPRHPSLNNLWAASRTGLNSLRACRRCTRSQPSPHLSCLWRARVRGKKTWSPCAGCVTDLPLTCFCMLMSYITLDGSSLHQRVETKVCAKNRTRCTHLFVSSHEYFRSRARLPRVIQFAHAAWMGGYMTTVNCKLPPNHFLCLFPCCCVVFKNICSEVPEINKSDAQSSHSASEQNVDERNVTKCCRACFMCVYIYTVHCRDVFVFARKPTL